MMNWESVGYSDGIGMRRLWVGTGWLVHAEFVVGAGDRVTKTGTPTLIFVPAGEGEAHWTLSSAGAAPQTPAWIDSVERLPQDDVRVLVRGSEGLEIAYARDLVCAATGVRVAHVSRRQWFLDFREGGRFEPPVNGVTHWMPLPEPPV